MVPDHLRGNVGGVVATILAGQELGLGAMASLRTIHLVKGKIVIGADAQLALLHQSGISSRWEETTDKAARLSLSRAPHTSAETFRYTIEEARTAGLAGKDVWRKYAPAMLRARCISLAARAYAPEVLMGCYTPDEAAEFVDVQQLPAPEPEPEPVAEDWEADWQDLAADEGVTLEGHLVPFLMANGLEPPALLAPVYRRRALKRLRNDASKLHAFIEATRDDLRVHFVPRDPGRPPGSLRAAVPRPARPRPLHPGEAQDLRRHEAGMEGGHRHRRSETPPRPARMVGRGVPERRHARSGAVSGAVYRLDTQRPRRLRRRRRRCAQELRATRTGSRTMIEPEDIPAILARTWSSSERRIGRRGDHLDRARKVGNRRIRDCERLRRGIRVWHVEDRVIGPLR